MNPTWPVIIVNPAAAGGRLGQDWPHIAHQLRNLWGPFTCQFTERAGDARRLAAAAVKAGQRLVIACGGDGTISEVVNGVVPLIIAGETVTVGILPYGTGGDFRRSLALPTRLADAIPQLANGITRLIDVGQATYQDLYGATTTRYFVNVASCGMGGEVSYRANQSTKTWGGALTFAYATLATAASYTHPHLWVSLDAQPPRQWRVANISVANGQYFGGGMKIAPQAKLDDGQLEVIIVHDLSTATMLTNGYRLYRGTHDTMSEVTVQRARQLTVRPVDPHLPVRLEIDGEAVGYLPAEFCILPRCLPMRCLA
jgi:diacylglycerol kinase (ATP)